MAELIGKTRGKRQRIRAVAGFSSAKRQRFLDALALTCNVTKAAEFAGVSTSTIHRARGRDEVFAGLWQEAMAIGYDRLEGLVLEHGGAGIALEPDPARAEAAGLTPEPFDFDKAMKILVYRRAAREGRTVQTGRPVRNADRDETNAALIKALAAAKRRVEQRRARND